MGVCMLATALEDRRQTIRYSRARKENYLELFSRGKTRIKEQRASMFQINLQLANENPEVNSLGVRIIERCYGGMSLLRNLRKTAQWSLVSPISLLNGSVICH